MSTINLEECQEHYEIDSSASGTMNILYSPLKGSWVKRGAPAAVPGGLCYSFKQPYVLVLELFFSI